MDSVFRRFFGLPNFRNDEKFENDFHDSGPGNPNSHGDFLGFSIFQQFDRIFAEMNEMFADFESAALSDKNESWPMPPNKYSSPRDELLKQPDAEKSPQIPPPKRDGLFVSPHFKRGWMWPDFENFQQGPREDKDIDEEIKANRKGILDLTPSLTPGKLPSENRGFYRSSITSITVQPDGKVEQRRTVRDSYGNEETTITCSDGNESTVTACGPGSHEDARKTDENFGLRKLWPFEKKKIFTPPEQDPSYETIFKNLFSGFLPKRD